MELNDIEQVRKAVFSVDTYNALLRSGAPAKLVTIATMQRQLRVA